jgi:hypothetical protein
LTLFNYITSSNVKNAGAKLISGFTLLCALSLTLTSAAEAGPREQAKRIHDRLAGIPASTSVINEMANLIEEGDVRSAAFIAMDNPAFYNVTLKRWVSPWTNEEADIFAPLNDYTATVIGIARDDIDFRQILSGDILYTADTNLGLPVYSNTNNDHYEAIERQNIDLQANLVANTQSSITGLPVEATAGIMTTRAAARSFFKDGTNRAMFRFTLINHLCTDLEGVKDISRVPDRIRQDVSRSPGGDSRIFINSCVGCHAGMDPLAQSFAYYEYEYDVESDPNGDRGFLAYNDIGEIDSATGTRVTAKHLINENNFPFGFIITDDSWDNYWRFGQNQNLGWDTNLSGSGSGAKSMGQELSNSQDFAQCQVTKVFKNVCLRDPQDSADRQQVELMTSNFSDSSYQIKSAFADAANYCKGE